MLANHLKRKQTDNYTTFNYQSPKELQLLQMVKNDCRSALRDTDCSYSKTTRSFFARPKNKHPNILHEIGRLREITFREVGEGTNL
jgi:hypothetical protein